MLLAPNRRRTRRRTSSVKRGVSSKDCSHIKLHGWKNAYLSANPDLISFEGRGRKPAADLNENLCLGFLHRLKGVYPRSGGGIHVWQIIGVLRTENDWNYWNGRNVWNRLLSWNGWNHWNWLLSTVFQAMEGLNPQAKRKILSDNPRRFYGI
jgi:hypothetical protein